MFNQSNTSEDLVAGIQEVIEKLLDMMGVVAAAEYKEDAVVQEIERDPKPLIFDIDCANPGILIGRGGQTLDCLQYLLRTIISHRMDRELPPIVIDVSGYKQRRYRYLRELAQRVADQVAESGNPFTLEPMSAYERRIVHTALNDDERVISESTGYDEGRKVVIKPAR
ncbi:MAG: KH domain-containing protein [Dehalococcoidaceae bacterium]|nr:KH domain-containing protein [Dehalococcoidaceae bacterium]